MVTTVSHTEAPRGARYRLGTEMAGLLIVLVGAWGGIVPYVGPIFGFSGDGSGSWTWNLAHSLLFLVPGAVACLAGLVVMAEGRGSSPARRTVLAVAGFMAAVSGAWFVVGALAWAALEGSAFFTGGTALRELAYWIGYSLGPGGLLLALGAFVIGQARAVAAPVVAEPVPRP